MLSHREKLSLKDESRTLTELKQNINKLLDFYDIYIYTSYILVYVVCICHIYYVHHIYEKRVLKCSDDFCEPSVPTDQKSARSGRVAPLQRSLQFD